MISVSLHESFFCELLHSDEPISKSAQTISMVKTMAKDWQPVQVLGVTHCFKKQCLCNVVLKIVFNVNILNMDKCIDI